MRKYFVLCFLFLSFNGLTQIESWLSVKGKAGFLIAHRSNMGHLAAEHAFATEISYEKQANGEKSWHEAYGNPRYGFTLFIGSVGNKELLGTYYGGYAFTTFPIVNKKKYTFSFKVGCGLGYGSKVYDPENNILSMATSTHINAIVSLGVDNRFLIGNHAITFGIDMTHFSNAAYEVPNLGINLPYLSLGYGHKIQKASDSIITHKVFEPYWEIGGVGILSAKEIFPTEGRKYPVYGFNTMVRRYFSRAAGIELSFDFISKQAILAYNTDVSKTQVEIIQLGLYAGYIVPFNKFHLLAGMGVYLKDKYQPEDAMYHRVGMRYVFNNGINANLTLKTHWGRADYAEFGIGYTLKR